MIFFLEFTIVIAYYPLNLVLLELSFVVIFHLFVQVKFSLEAAKLARVNASLGFYDASAGMFLCTTLQLQSCSFRWGFPVKTLNPQGEPKYEFNLVVSVSSRQARSLAEDAFFHPSIMSVSYYSFEHCFAVYSVCFWELFFFSFILFEFPILTCFCRIPQSSFLIAQIYSYTWFWYHFHSHSSCQFQCNSSLLH